MGAPVILVRDEAQGQALIERLPAERRAMFRPATPDRAADVLRGYIDIGFGGFTFGNPSFRTPESFELAAELIDLLES